MPRSLPRRVLRGAGDATGATLLEILVALAVLGLILTPILLILSQGSRTEATARRQFGQQEKARRVLGQIADGADQGGTPIPGLRQANAASVNGGLSYRAATTVVTYYASGRTLYRKTCDTGSPGCVPEDPVDPAGGTEVLADVERFEVARSGRLFTIRLEVRTPGSGAGSGDTGIRLVTKVVARNLE